jgi:hypothetical protein
MPMPSLFKYFAFVGAALFGLLSLANFLLDPSTGATPVAKAPAKPTVAAVQHDPRASKIERWRDDQVALKTAQQTQTSQNASLVTKSVAEPPRPARTATVEQAKPQPAPQLAAVASVPTPAPPPVATAPARAPETSAIVGTESTDEIAAARAAKLAERKAKVAKAKARKERLARQQQTARDRYASNQQDQFYYGQRNTTQQPFATHYSSAFAPQQSYGPFGNGWGRAW